MGCELQVQNSYRAQQWGEVIRRCQESGLSNREFCRQNGIVEKTYYYWLKKLRGEMIEEIAPEIVHLEDKDSGAESMIQIQYGDARLQLPGKTDVDAIAAVLRALQQL